METTQIKIKLNTWKELLKLKEIGDSFDDVIKILIIDKQMVQDE